MRKAIKTVVACLLFAIAFGANAAASGEEQPEIVLTRIPECSTCPEWELRVFSDGTTIYRGIDSVRFIGERGTFFTIRNFKDFPEDRFLHERLQGQKDDLKKKLDAAMKEIQGFIESVGTLKNIAKSDSGGKNEIGESFTVMIRLNGKEEKAELRVTGTNQGTANRLISTIKGLYFSPSDWEPATTFVRDPAAILYISGRWTNAVNPTCASGPEDFSLIVFSDGRMAISGRFYDDGARRSQSVSLTEDRGARGRNLLHSLARDLSQLAEYSGTGKDRLEVLSSSRSFVTSSFYPPYTESTLIKQHGKVENISYALLGYGVAKANRPESVIELQRLIVESKAQLGGRSEDFSAFCAGRVVH